MKKGILQIFLEKIQEAFGGEKASSKAVSSKNISPTTSSIIAPPKVHSRETAEIPTSTASLAEQLRAEIARDAAYLYVFETSEATTIPAGMVFTAHGGANNEEGYITITNGNPKALPAGMTGGYSVHLPDQIEAAASGHHITVRVVARASGSDQSHFAVAYSTNEVGNSGWRKFTAGPEWSIHTMEYDVPVMKNGHGDFIGILPDSEGNPGTEFCYLAISISEKH